MVTASKCFTPGRRIGTRPELRNDGERIQHQHTEIQIMPTFDADTTEINAFEVEGADLYIFSQYFDHEEIFSELREYYDSEHYRFEVPTDEIDDVEAFLGEHFYDLQRVAPAAIEPYCVVKPKYTDYADILRNSVYHTSRDDQNVFVMQDRLSAEQAVEQGAMPLADADINFQL